MSPELDVLRAVLGVSSVIGTRADRLDQVAYAPERHQPRSRSLAAVIVRDPLWAAPERGLAAVVAAHYRASDACYRGYAARRAGAGRDSNYAADMDPSGFLRLEGLCGYGERRPGPQPPGQWPVKRP